MLLSIKIIIEMQVSFDQEEDLIFKGCSSEIKSLALSASPLAGKASKFKD
jgi:hypothetical protein